MTIPETSILLLYKRIGENTEYPKKSHMTAVSLNIYG